MTGSAGQQFLFVALPIMVTLVVTMLVARWSENKRLDDIVARLGRIETKLGSPER